MSIGNRLSRLEQSVAPKEANRPDPWTDAKLLVWFGQAGEAGEFADEPDFEDALQAGALVRLLYMLQRLAITRGW
jgi:hypothetical protein